MSLRIIIQEGKDVIVEEVTQRVTTIEKVVSALTDSAVVEIEEMPRNPFYYKKIGTGGGNYVEIWGIWMPKCTTAVAYKSNVFVPGMGSFLIEKPLSGNMAMFISYFNGKAIKKLAPMLYEGNGAPDKKTSFWRTGFPNLFGNTDRSCWHACTGAMVTKASTVAQKVNDLVQQYFAVPFNGDLPIVVPCTIDSNIKERVFLFKKERNYISSRAYDNLNPAMQQALQLFLIKDDPSFEWGLHLKDQVFSYERVVSDFTKISI